MYTFQYNWYKIYRKVCVLFAETYVSPSHLWVTIPPSTDRLSDHQPRQFWQIESRAKKYILLGYLDMTPFSKQAQVCIVVNEITFYLPPTRLAPACHSNACNNFCFRTNCVVTLTCNVWNTIFLHARYATPSYSS